MDHYYIRTNYFTFEGDLSLVAFKFFGYFDDSSDAFESFLESEYSLSEECSLVCSSEVSDYIESHQNYILEF